MVRIKNIIEKINAYPINSYYSPRYDDFLSIIDRSDVVGTAFLAFHFGYMQGHKAAISEAKKAVQ